MGNLLDGIAWVDKGNNPPFFDTKIYFLRFVPGRSVNLSAISRLGISSCKLLPFPQLAGTFNDQVFQVQAHTNPVFRR